ncbi:hypothetical protein [Xanthomonas albilineans]|uniref:hypothetical protein n=1 Tax=Xanthomonas albilineans TaxID=29447 RepID=UPI000AED8E4F|nr:hypothetical protein [Xanthomonas albilineans]
MPGRMPSIREFATDNRDWRIEGLGAIERNEHGLVIEVFLTPNSLRELTTEPYPMPERRRVLVSVGQLPYLRVGSHWQNGKLKPQMTGVRRVLRNVSIRSDKVRIVRLGDTLGPPSDKKAGQRWLVPPFRYRYPTAMYDARCLAIEHDGDPYGILLPTVEAIRFYYAPSTDLAHVMFSGALQHNRPHVIDTDYSGPADDVKNRMVVALRQWLADTDAWVIGRILGDPHAASGSARIHESLIIAGANMQRAFPECGLPFEGNADWTVQTVDIAPSRASNSRWLILELEKCTGPFPYEELEVMRDNDNRQGDPLKDIPDVEKRPAWAKPMRRADESTGELQSEEAPRADVQAKVFADPGQRFEAIKDKKIIKTAKESCNYKSGQLRLPDAVVAALLGTGRGTYGGSQVNPAEIEWNPGEAETATRVRTKGLAASFEALERVVAAMNEVAGVRAEVRSAKGLAMVPRGYPERRGDWAWLDSKKRQRRGVVIVDVVAQGRRACVIECELRPTETRATGILLSVEGGLISDGELHQVLRSHVKVRGVWKSTAGTSSIHVKSLKHTQSTPSARADAILHRIESSCP